MKELGKILAYLVATVLLGAVMAPPLFWGGQWLAEHGILTFLKETDFRRFFDRAVLIAAILLLWPLVRWLRVRHWNEFGLRRDPKPWRRFSAGVVISLAGMVLLAGILLAKDGYRIRSSPRWAEMALLPVTAVTVALIEEFLFRGALHGLVRRSSRPATAILAVSALYSVVHFVRPPDSEGDAVVTWASGLAQIPRVFWQFGQPWLVLGGFLTLFLVGVILGCARHRTASLWMPIGLHTGWIIGKFGFGKIARRSGDLWPWFGPDLLVGIGPVLVVIGTGAVVWLWLRYVDR